MFRALIIIGLVGLAVYAVYAFYYYTIQRSVIYPRQLVERPADSEPVINGDRLWIETSQGKVEAWYLPSYVDYEAGGEPLLIFAHANAELIDYWPQHVDALREMGIGVLLVEYPGYGRSAGEPSQQSLTEVFTKAYDLAMSWGAVNKDQVAVCGRSLGGGVACALAKERKVNALILMSTFTSVRAMAKNYLLPSFLILDPFDNLAVVKHFKGKLLVVHGTRDEYFPYAMGVELAQAAPDGNLLTYDCGHNDCIPDWNEFWREQAWFFKEAGVLK